MVEIELSGPPMSKRGSLVVDDDTIQVILPKVFVEPWVIPVTDVTWVDSLAAAAGGADASTAAVGGLRPPWRR